MVIVSDYGKGFVSDELFSLVRNNAKFVSVDPKPSRLLQYESPNLLTPNRMEALELAGKSRLMKDEFPQSEVVQEIFRKFSPPNWQLLWVQMVCCWLKIKKLKR